MNSKIGKRLNSKGQQKPLFRRYKSSWSLSNFVVLGYFNVLLTFITTVRVVRAIFPIFFKYPIIQTSLLISKPTTIFAFYDCTSLYLRLYTCLLEYMFNDVRLSATIFSQILVLLKNQSYRHIIMHWYYFKTLARTSVNASVLTKHNGSQSLTMWEAHDLV